MENIICDLKQKIIFYAQTGWYRKTSSLDYGEKFGYGHDNIIEAG